MYMDSKDIHKTVATNFIHNCLKLQTPNFLSTIKQVNWGAMCCVLSRFSHILLFVTPGTVADQAPLSMGFSRQEHCSGLPSLLPGNFLTQGSNLSHQGSPKLWYLHTIKCYATIQKNNIPWLHTVQPKLNDSNRNKTVVTSVDTDWEGTPGNGLGRWHCPATVVTQLWIHAKTWVSKL